MFLNHTDVVRLSTLRHVKCYEGYLVLKYTNCSIITEAPKAIVVTVTAEFMLVP